MNTPTRRRGPRWDAQRVLALRRHLGLTQQELAQELGTRQQTISEWETGAYRPRGTSATLLFVIAERAEFQYGDDQEPPSEPPPGPGGERTG